MEEVNKINYEADYNDMKLLYDEQSKDLVKTKKMRDELHKTLIIKEEILKNIQNREEIISKRENKLENIELKYKLNEANKRGDEMKEMIGIIINSFFNTEK